jgi:polyisoprenyl-phosphate glycosyltransferase
MARIGVVIPVYKAEDCLDELYRRLVTSLEAITSDFELVFVEDCGGDKSWDGIKRLGARDPRVKGLQFSRNFGQHHGIAAGLDHCDGDWVVVMDCDLQDPPEAIPTLVGRALQGFDVVLARRLRRHESRMRQIQSMLFAWLFERLTGRNYDPRVGAFRLLSRRVVLANRRFREKTRLLGGAIDWLGFPTSTIDVEQAPRFAGESSYSLGKLLRLAIDGIIAYSDRPLRLSILSGMTIAAASLLFGLALIAYSLFGQKPVPGWTSVIVSIYFVGGLILANLGLIGAYIGKIFEETKDRPPYVIAATVGDFAASRYHFTETSADPHQLALVPSFEELRSVGG